MWYSSKRDVKAHAQLRIYQNWTMGEVYILEFIFPRLSQNNTEPRKARTLGTGLAYQPPELRLRLRLGLPRPRPLTELERRHFRFLVM
jgi:hypothetical protein